MAISIITILKQDPAPDRVDKCNANFAALATVSGMDQVLSADMTIADNRSQVTAGFVTVPAAFNLNIAGTGILLVI